MTALQETDRILVTGGAGFIGSHLVRRLTGEGRRVRVLEKPGTDASHLPQEAEVVFADLGRDAIDAVAADCDVVLHLAANPNLWARDPADFERVNHQGTRRVLNAAARARKIVHVSTESILSPPGLRGPITEETATSLDDMIGDYCRSKWLAEQAALEAARAGRPVVIVRPSIPVGPGDRRMGPLTRMIRDFARGRLHGYLQGDVNLIDVRDVAGGILSAAERGEIGGRYLLVNENWTVVQLLRCLAPLVARPAPRWRVPYAAALGFAHLEEWFCAKVARRRIPMATVTGVRLTQRSMRFDGRRSAQALGLPPMRDCREALARAVDELRAAGEIPAAGAA